MPLDSVHLHVAPPCSQSVEPPDSELGDLGLTAAIFAIALLPIACDLAGIGGWGGGSLGLGTLGVLLAGRELWAWLLARCRSGGRP